MGSIDKKKLLSAAYYYSYTRFVLNLFSLFEDMDKAEATGFLDGFVEMITEKTEAFLDGGDEYPGLVAVRERVLGLLNQMTLYLDCFCIHEYALDRMERKLCGTDPVRISPEVLADDLMDYVMDGENQLDVNHRIQTIIGELPVRFTKSKFYSVIEESLRPYKGRDKSDLDRMIWRIRSAAALPLFEKAGEDPELFTGYRSMALELENCDYLSLSKEEYTELKSRYEESYGNLSLLLGQLVCLPPLINDLCVMMRAAAFAEPSPYRTALQETLGEILQRSRGKDGFFTEDDGRVFEMFAPLEGKQEYYWEQYVKQMDRYSSGDEDIFVAGQLLSGNFAAPLERNADGVKVTDEIYEASLERLFTELETRLKRTAKFTSRAVMAKVLAEIPVWFNTLEEIQAYIQDSLSLCLDTAEKDASMVNLKQIMVEGNALV